MTLIGAAASALSLFKLAGVFLLGFPEKMMPIAALALGFFFLSLYAFIWGLIRWNNSSSEIKALGTSPAELQKSIAASKRPSTADREVKVIAYSTDPIAPPGSVTEQTIRQILALPDSVEPAQVISLMTLGGPSFALPDHYNHIHVGY